MFFIYKYKYSISHMIHLRHLYITKISTGAQNAEMFFLDLNE